jgi:hypothetical protein
VSQPKLPFHHGEGRVLRNKRHHQQGKFNTKSPAPPKASVTFSACLLLRTGLYLKLLQAASFLPVLVGADWYKKVGLFWTTVNKVISELNLTKLLR